MHELKFSELAKKFNVRNKNGTLKNLLVFTENINWKDYASCKEQLATTSKLPLEMETYHAT